MLAVREEDREDEAGPGGVASQGALGAPIERYGYRAPGSSRVFGGLGTITVCLLIAAGFAVTLDTIVLPPREPAPLTVALLPIAPSPRPDPKTAETPKPERTEPTKPQPREIDPAPRTPVTPAPPALVAPPQRIAIAAPQQAAETAPAPPRPAPPPDPPSSHGRDSWEGRVLARLQRYRRYPGDAQHARQQGIAYVRFRIDRNGHVLSSSVERSSGYPALDAAALDTLRRADPLPKIPPDRADEVELLVPVEFFLRG